MANDLVDADPNSLVSILDLFADGWARRRAVEALFRAGVPRSFEAAMSLAASLEDRAQRMWALSTLMATRELTPGEMEEVMSLPLSPVFRRRLERLGTVNPEIKGSRASQGSLIFVLCSIEERITNEEFSPAGERNKGQGSAAPDHPDLGAPLIAPGFVREGGWKRSTFNFQLSTSRAGVARPPIAPRGCAVRISNWAGGWDPPLAPSPYPL